LETVGEKREIRIQCPAGKREDPVSEPCRRKGRSGSGILRGKIVFDGVSDFFFKASDSLP
jgi:hypothetical protein